MKSVTIRESSGYILFKITHKKNGEVELLQSPRMSKSISVEVRDDNNCKVQFGKWEEDK